MPRGVPDIHPEWIPDMVSDEVLALADEVQEHMNYDNGLPWEGETEVHVNREEYLTALRF